MYLVGKLQLTRVTPKEYEGRKYFKAIGLADDKNVYNLSLPGTEYPQVGDVYNFVVEPSERDFKPMIRLQKVTNE